MHGSNGEEFSMGTEGALIDFIEPGSIAEEMEIETGDILLEINSNKVADLIDYKYLIADDYLEVKVQKQNGEQWILEIEKDYDEDLGIGFQFATFDGINRCQNRCIFCFVDQMPPGVRDSLYVKDDDYRLSFLQGNFVTLTNLSEDDLQRIISFRLSPLYVSVHTTNPELRQQMLRNKRAAKIMEILKELAEAGLTIHTQVVLCPGINDGPELERTIADLSGLWPAVQSIAIVPVGLTRYRHDLTELRQVTAQEALELVKNITSAQQNFRKQIDKSLVYLSDEFYLLAGQEVPPVEYYGDFEQLENGVGQVRLLYENFAKLKDQLPAEVIPAKKVIVATGILGQQALQPIFEELGTVRGLFLEVLAIENRFFGRTATVTGLVTGSDIIAAIKEKNVTGDLLVIPSVMCRKGEQVFLDDMPLPEVEKKIGLPVKVAEMENGLSHFFKILFEN